MKDMFRRFRRQKHIRQLSLLLVEKMITWLCILTFKTSRTKLHGQEALKTAMDSDQSVLVVLWHGRFLYCAHGLRQLNCSATTMASYRFIGLAISRVVSRYFKLKIINGSSSHGWSFALKQLSRLLSSGSNVVALTIDGPSGPHRIAKPGAVKLACRKEAKMILMTATSNRYYTFKSWDKHRIPKPCSTMHIYFSEVLSVPEVHRINKTEHLYITEQLNRFQDDIDQKHHGDVESLHNTKAVDDVVS